MRIHLTIPLLLGVVLATSVIVSIATTVTVSQSLDRYLAQLNAEIALDRRALGSVRTVTGDGSLLEKLQETQRRSGAVLRPLLTPTLAPQSFTEEEILSMGVAITNDGWFAFIDSSSLPQQVSDFSEYELAIGDRVFSVERVLRDSVHGILYVKANASPESVVAFSETLALTPGDEVYVTDLRGYIGRFSIVRDRSAVDFSVGYDIAFPSTWELSGEVPERGILFDGNSAFVGFIIDGQPVLLHDFANSLSGAIQARRLSQGTLGISGIDVTRAQNFDTASYGRRGFLISTDPSHIGILPNGPAASAGLRVGDMIIAIDGISIDATNSITRILSQFSPGDRVTVSYIREGNEIVADIVLANAQDLLY